MISMFFIDEIRLWGNYSPIHLLSLQTHEVQQLNWLYLVIQGRKVLVQS